MLFLVAINVAVCLLSFTAILDKRVYEFVVENLRTILIIAYLCSTGISIISYNLYLEAKRKAKELHDMWELKIVTKK